MSAPTRTLTAEQLSAPWKLRDRIGMAFCWFIGLAFCFFTLALILYFLVQGFKYLTPSLLWTRPQGGFSQEQSGGLLDPLVGTFILAVLGTLIAVPIGVGVAVWLSEFGRPFGLARAVESAIEMVSGAPDIVLALFGTVIFTAPALGFLSRKTVDGIVLGRSFLVASIIMSAIAIPLIVASVREGLQAIPGHVREASYAVGKTKAATIRKILLPAARPSIITGTILGMGRIIGDTAIVVVLLGSTLTMFPAEGPPGLDILRGQGSSLTTYVFNNSPTGDGNQPEKAFAAAFVLLIAVLILNTIVEIVNRRWKAPEWRG
jgi:phosphate transport system permease protein